MKFLITPTTKAIVTKPTLESIIQTEFTDELIRATSDYNIEFDINDLVTEKNNPEAVNFKNLLFTLEELYNLNIEKTIEFTDVINEIKNQQSLSRIEKLKAFTRLIEFVNEITNEYKYSIVTTHDAAILMYPDPTKELR